MMKDLKKILFIASLLINALFILIVISAFSGTMASVSFHSLDSREKPYTAAAAVVSFPQGREVLFGPLAISLARGDRAALQISAVSGNRQANRLITPLYDRRVISVSETGYGLLITALDKGSATLQTLGEDGIIDIAVITVSE